jgi:hypothetical protein
MIVSLAHQESIVDLPGLMLYLEIVTQGIIAFWELG